MLTTLQRALLLAVLLLAVLPTLAAEPDPTPILRIEPGMHFAKINRIDVDAAERFVVSVSDDKTARVWDLRTGELLQVLRPPIGDGDEGKLFAVAVSPDGGQVAVAGWVSKSGFEEVIYLFDRETEKLNSRITGLPMVVYHLAFSSDGSKLAVGLGGKEGIRLYSTHDWKEIAQDSNYDGPSLSVDFDTQGHILSSSYDGQVRLYDTGLELLHSYKTQAGSRPYFARFSPDGQRVAVGFEDSAKVEILTADDLKLMHMQDTQGIDFSLHIVAWSQDGHRLYAGGRYNDGNSYPLVVWGDSDANNRLMWWGAQNTIVDIKPLKDGGVVYSSADPVIGRLSANGQMMWKQTAGVLALGATTNTKHEFSISKNGKNINFNYERENQQGKVKTGLAFWQSVDLQFGVPAVNAALSMPRHKAAELDIADWENKYIPKLNGYPLQLEDYERSRSLAIV